MASSVNMMRVRQQASLESRRQSSSWNPFAQTFRPPPRASTFDAERGEADRYDHERLTHASTVPNVPTLNRQEQSDATAINAGDDIAVPDVSSERELTGPEAGLRHRVGTGSIPEDAAKQEPEQEKPKEKLVLGFLRHVPPKEPFTWKNQLRRTVGSSWINVLLVCAPAGIAMNYTGVSGQIVFAINFIAIIPLAAMLGFATEEIALRTGETLGGLINATFG